MLCVSALPSAMASGPEAKSDTVNVLFGDKAKELLTSSVYGLDGDYVKNVPNFNRRNSLTGLIPGLIVMQNNGEPGEEGGSMYIRGQRTLGGKNTPWVLVDGVQRNMDMLDPNEIESVTVLKDAAATAVFGFRGSNGVILVKTKRGAVNQPLKLNFNARVGFQTPTKLPEFLGSYQYSKLYNEALMNEGKEPFYSSEAIDAYRTGGDPLRYPDVNWRDEYLKDNSVQQAYNLNASGGNKSVNYFFNLGYAQNSGLYNVDENANTYGTNADMRQYSARSNVDVQVTRNFKVGLDIAGRIQKRTYPGMRANSVSSVFGSLMKLPPNVFPARYEGEYSIENSDETIVNPLPGTTQYKNHPYGLLNNSGYSAYTSTTFLSTLYAEHRLDFLTPGLSVMASFSYDSDYKKNVNRSKTFAVYELVDADNRVVRQIGTNGQMGSVWTPLESQNRMDFQAGLNYKREFGRHHVDAMAKYNFNRYQTNGTNLPNTHIGVLGRADYAFDRRYMAEFSFSCFGTEQFPSNNRFGFFPAVSIGWNIANESFVEDNVGWLDVLKLRVSHGLTGSDKGLPYFYYLENYGKRPVITIGTGGAAPGGEGWYRAMLANPDVTWEKCRKTDIGLDAVFFGNRLDFTIDLFKENSYDILVESGNIPLVFGNIIPAMNVGKVMNKGMELSLGFSDTRNGWNYFVNGNLMVTENKLVYKDEQFRKYEYRYETGHPLGVRMGYVAEGFFHDYDEINNSPDQSYFGVVRPGDIKYRDMNNDGKIDEDDISRIGIGEMPKVTYGLTFGFSYKGLDFSALLQGTGRSQGFMSAVYAYGFPDNGNVSKSHLGRWAYYEDPFTGERIDTRDTATYPRLSISETGNNRQNSTFWLKDLSYLRLKTVELGYSFDRMLKGTFISKARVYVSGYNLLTFSKLDDIDPEMATAGIAYPIQRVFNVGVNLTF